jgi:FtsP/CotA-like multicopper oxidase with cupredoxin domain
VNSHKNICTIHNNSACGSCGLAQGNFSDCFNDQCVTADGKERGVMSINRKIPGPTIHVCKNDMIVVDVTNQMGGTSAAIHWHGFHQRDTPFMDGVPFVTQCPIDFSTTFRYSFRASEAGTQFYHSHSGHHKVNGHHGGIVVRQPFTDDPNFSTYDRDMKEHLIVVTDWMEYDAEM